MAKSWFLLPIVTVTIAGEEVDRPDYVDDMSGASWSSVDELDIGGARRKAVHVGADAAALDALAAEKQVKSVWGGDATEQEVAGYLNDKFGVERTYAEWSEMFLTGEMS